MNKPAITDSQISIHDGKAILNNMFRMEKEMAKVERSFLTMNETLGEIKALLLKGEYDRKDE